MTEIFQRYRIALIVMAIIAFALVAWYFIFRGNTAKIPSRGVFVMEKPVYSVSGNYQT